MVSSKEKGVSVDRSEDDVVKKNSNPKVIKMDKVENNDSRTVIGCDLDGDKTKVVEEVSPVVVNTEGDIANQVTPFFPGPLEQVKAGEGVSVLGSDAVFESEEDVDDGPAVENEAVIGETLPFFRFP
ncbi:hypothetical protein U1Q18_017909 [Sarracenia purpurea var. burkii]